MHKWRKWKGFQKSNKMMIDCANIQPMTSLWQCVTHESTECKNPANVVCNGFKRLQLKGHTQNVCSGQLEMEENSRWIPVKNNKTSSDVRCQQMHCGTAVRPSRDDDNGTQLTCTDNVTVELTGRCYGVVQVKVNGLTHPVCASAWTQAEADVVCNELNCGTAISHEAQKSKLQGIMDHVSCLGSESSLWHCRAMHEDGLRCSSKAYVVCAGSVSVRLEDGPGKCAGRLEIQYEGRWKQVYEQNWTDTNSNTVCKQMNCGNKHLSPHRDKFIHGSGDFLTKTVECNTEASTIHECFPNNPKGPSKSEAVGITCEEHKVVFLKGDDSCSGTVGIEHGDHTYWLSGSNGTWDQDTANAVCQQKHCGKASAFSASVLDNDTKIDVWDKSYNCSSDTKSLFECDTQTQSSDHNDTIATVNCSGKVTIELTNKCWGTVNVCVDGKCGGVCEDTWTDSKSVMLCKELGCGDTVFRANNQPGERPVMLVKSLYTTKQTTRLTQCNFVMNVENKTTCKSAYVVCSGSVKPRFITSRDKCSGNVELSYEGEWLPMCMNGLKEKELQDTICEELDCGQAEKTVDYFGPKPAGGRVISQLNCSTDDAKSLSACPPVFKNDICTLAGLQCKNLRKMTVSETCRGAVSVYSNGRLSAVSAEGWTETEGQRLCRDLQCGGFKSKKVYNTSQELSFWDRSIRCENDTNNIWDCEKPATASQRQQLIIECQDKPNVTLSERCHGAVKINGTEVCNSHWDMSYSHLLCQEQMCSNAVVNVFTDPKPNADYYHISCDDFHHELGQCKRVQGKCNGQLVSVYCVGNVKFKTNKTCGGQLLVNYRNNWERICPLNFSPAFKEKLCQKLGCNGHNDSTVRSDNKEKVTLETALECSADHNDIEHCVIEKRCQGFRPAEIYCNGYKLPPMILEVSKTSTTLINLVVGLVIVLLIIIAVPICIVKNGKNIMNIPARLLSRKEVECESGEFEEIGKTANEMEDFSHGKAEVIMEHDAQSTSSFPYDDIDEAVEAQLLTSQGATSDASRDNYRREDALDQGDDGEIYEVDDPLENYDDIEASPEITPIKAEVYDRPKTTCEGGAVTPPGLVQGDVQ
ncbi:scavenger receptor cysteine-rich type 1 protein M160 isoform X3 [Scophthalmus maximus]|nr:scavenger receptor cysteine-rich type 1 protein M160 isoform X3 [Scophthalmus maximus]